MRTKFICFIGILLLVLSGVNGQPLRVGVAGLNHDHVNGLLDSYKKGEVVIMGIAESNTALVQKYKLRYGLADSLFYPNVSRMLDHIHPDAVLAYNAIADHLGVVEACAPRGISVMVEKPLAFSTKDADRMVTLVNQYHIQLLTNYETTWYPSCQRIYQETHERHVIGDIRKMVARDGHQGPKEIGCSPEFLQWLTDPAKNGAGALIDFGCYGADLMTWMMNGEMPLAVTAITRRYKPSIYPHVDDDATIIVEYPGATGLIEASWNWPVGVKDFQVFGQTGFFYAPNGNSLEERLPDTAGKVELGPAWYKNSLAYLAAILREQIHPVNDPSGLDNNVIVVRILDAAIRSAKEGKRIVLEK